MKARRRLLVAATILLSPAFAKAQVIAVVASAVNVRSPSCTARPVEWDAFVAALRVELGAEGVRVDQDDASSAPMDLSIEASPCLPDATDVEVVVNGPPAGRLARTVSLADVAPALRARTAAIASAQLVLWSRQPTTLDGSSAAPIAPDAPAPPEAPSAVTPEAPVPPSPPVAPVVVIVAPPAPVQPVVLLAPRTKHPSLVRRVGVAGEFTRYTGPGSSLYGGRALSEWRLPWDALAARFDVAGATGGFDTTLGHVTLWSVVAVLGGEWLSEGDGIELALGPMLEVGYTRVIGRASGGADQGSGGGSTLATVLLGSGRLRLAGDFWAALEVDGGAELWGIRALANNQTVGSTAGALFAARLGIAYAP